MPFTELFHHRLRWLFLLIAVFVLGSAVFVSQEDFLGVASRLLARIPDFATIFLGIFIEAAPFLLLGTVISGFVEIFLPADIFLRIIPRNSIFNTLLGSFMGLFFPVCECGVVPLTRRMFHKGMPMSAGIAFLLAAPVLNPIVIFSTASAFGVGKTLYLRMGVSFLIAMLVGLVFGRASQLDILRSNQIIPEFKLELPLQKKRQPARSKPRTSIVEKLQQVLLISADEFMEMSRYLIAGAGLAAAMQTFIPQSLLLSIGQGPLISVLALMLMAVLLSVCSTVDAFIALGFIGTFSPGAILAFLIFGPMVDIKSILMYGHVFRWRTVFYLVLLPFLMSVLAGVIINLYFPGL